MEEPVIILDLETTGMSAYKDRVTEIAAVKLLRGEIIEEFHSLVNPGYPIPRHITRLTGITNDMVKDAPAIKEVLPSLKNFLADHTIIAHNAGFDMRFLSYNFLMHHNHELENKSLCTYKLANRLLDIPRRRLVDCCEYFDVTNTHAHRAMSDVLATTQVFSHMTQLLDQINISSLQHILDFSNMPRTKAIRLLESDL